MRIALIVIGSVLGFVLLFPVGVLAFVGWIFRRIPGLHRLGHFIDYNMTTPILDGVINWQKRVQARVDRG